MAEKILGDGGDGISELAEEEGVAHGGSADTADEKVCVKDIIAKKSRIKFAEAIKGDSTLTTARALADQVAEGYHWTEGLLFLTRLEVMGESIKQLCLPLPYRHRCLSLAHERFDRAGRNKMCIQIKTVFLLAM